LLHFVNDRPEEVGNEGAEVEADMAELDMLQARLDRIADGGELDQLAGSAVSDAPVEEEIADDLRENLGGLRANQLAVELELQAEIDDRFGRDPHVDADLAELRE